MYKITIDSIVTRRNQDVAETELDGNIVLLHIDNGKYYNLNITSSDLWRWLTEKSSVKNLVQKLCDKYSCNKEQAQQDVLKFLQELEIAHLLLIE